MQLRATAFVAFNVLYVLVVFYFYVLFGEDGKFRIKEGGREINTGREREKARERQELLLQF